MHFSAVNLNVKLMSICFMRSLITSSLTNRPVCVCVDYGAMLLQNSCVRHCAFNFICVCESVIRVLSCGKNLLEMHLQLIRKSTVKTETESRNQATRTTERSSGCNVTKRKTQWVIRYCSSSLHFFFLFTHRT